MNQLEVYLFIALIMFCLGLWGVLQRRSLIAMLISLELMLNAANINFLAFNRFLAPEPAVGQIIALFVMGTAAAEAAIGLSIFLAVYRRNQNIDIERIRDLKG